MNYRLGDLKRQIKRVLEKVRENFQYWGHNSYRAILRSLGMDCAVQYTTDGFRFFTHIAYFAIDQRGNPVGNFLHEDHFDPHFSYKTMLEDEKLFKKEIKQNLKLKKLSQELAKRLIGVTTVLECILLCKELGIKLVRPSDLKLGNFYVSERQLKVVLPFRKVVIPQEAEAYKLTFGMHLELNAARFTKKAQKKAKRATVIKPVAQPSPQHSSLEHIFDFLNNRDKEQRIFEQRYFKTIKLLGPGICSNEHSNQKQSLKL